MSTQTLTKAEFLAAIEVTGNSSFRYDPSNRLDISVGATGVVTLDAVGSGAKFVFSDSIEGESVILDGANPYIRINQPSSTAFTDLYMEATNEFNISTFASVGTPAGSKIRLDTPLIEISGAVIKGALIPDIDDGYDLGSSTLAWAGLYLGPDEVIHFQNVGIISQIVTTKHTSIDTPNTAGAKVLIKNQQASFGALLDTASIAASHKTFTFPNTTGTLALTSNIAIGASLGSATEGSILFAGPSGVFAQDNANFFWHDAGDRLIIGSNTPAVAHTVITTKLQVGHPTYFAPGGSAGARMFEAYAYANGSANNISCVAGYFDARYNGTGTNPNVVGFQMAAALGSSSSTALQVIGGDFSGNASSANGAGTVAGIVASGVSASGGTVTLAHGVRGSISANNTSFITTGNIVSAILSMGATGTITDLRGLNLSGWSASGTITNSYGIYMDTSIDRGATLKYAIYSLSTSPSLLSGPLTVQNVATQLQFGYDSSNYGNVTVGATGVVTFNAVGSGSKFVFSDAVEGPINAYDATSWNGSAKFATEDAVRDKIETLSAGSGITRTITVTSGSATMGSSASTDYVYMVAGAHTMSLPTAVGNTNRYTVKNNHSANITIDTAGAENIEGAASISIGPEESVDIISDNTNWFII
jgi:hypothetical protein